MARRTVIPAILPDSAERSASSTGPAAAPGFTARSAEELAEELGLPFRHADQLTAERSALELVPATLARRLRILPLERERGSLVVAMADPLDVHALDQLTAMVALPVEAVVAHPDELAEAMQRAYPEAATDGPVEPRRERWAPARPETVQVEERPAPTDADVVGLVDNLLRRAIEEGASDVHWEPLAQRFRIRFRIDGVLLEVESIPPHQRLAVISRLKLMAGLSIAEKRVPQDGRHRITVGDRVYDLRVSSVPTVHGESIVMRVLDQEGVKLGLGELGLDARDQATFRELLGVPDGMVLVTGPTGSGKTTTLYSCLHHLNRPDRKIVTVEDPVEYSLPGINQVPVRADVGLTFGAALRAMLRQAPNVIMVGEIRDAETASIAINAAQTGHLVFSTLHTNDAVGAVARLTDLGVAPYQVAGALRAVVAQRLARRVCRHCGRAVVPSPREWAAVGSAGPVSGRFAQGTGCRHCHGTGYRGRVALFEVLVLDEEWQQVIHEQRGAAPLRALARARGVRSLRMDGIAKAAAGLTTLEEVAEVTVDEQTS
jgi:type IV pilus assembly protein PilB